MVVASNVLCDVLGLSTMLITLSSQIFFFVMTSNIFTGIDGLEKKRIFVGLGAASCAFSSLCVSVIIDTNCWEILLSIMLTGTTIIWTSLNVGILFSQPCFEIKYRKKTIGIIFMFTGFW